MEWTRAFAFFREDPKWLTKLAIGAGLSMLSLVVIGLPFVVGYALRVIRDAAERRDSAALPEWNEGWGLLRDGTVGVAVYVAWLLPFVAGAAGLRWGFGTLVNAFGEDSLVVAVAGLMLGLGGGAVAGVALLLLYFYLPAAFVRVALTRRWVDGFALRANVGFIRNNLRGYGRAAVLSLGAGGLAQIGVAACGVGIFATAFWAALVGARAFGEVARGDASLAAVPR